MSLLLDALRKSERQRNLGKAPGLDIPLIRTQASSAGTRRLLVLLLLLVAVAGISWLLLSGDDDVALLTDADPASGTDVADAEPPIAPELPEAGRGQAGAGVAAASKPEPAGSAFRLPEARAQAQVKPIQSPDPADNDGAAAEAGSLSDDLPTALDQQPQQNQSLDDLARVAETRLAAAAAAESSENAATSNVAVDRQSDRNEATESWRPGAPEPISFYDLPLNVRQELAEVKVTIRVYNDEPGKRFAVINRERYVEGDEIIKGLKLSEIQRDALVFEYQQYRFIYR